MLQEKTMEEKANEILEGIKGEFSDYAGRFKITLALCHTTETKLKEEVPKGKTALLDAVVRVLYQQCTHKDPTGMRSVDYAGYMMYTLDKLDVSYEYSISKVGSVSITADNKAYGLYDTLTNVVKGAE